MPGEGSRRWPGRDPAAVTVADGIWKLKGFMPGAAPEFESHDIVGERCVRDSGSVPVPRNSARLLTSGERCSGVGGDCSSSSWPREENREEERRRR